jgi:hypothetical protein
MGGGSTPMSACDADGKKIKNAVEPRNVVETRRRFLNIRNKPMPPRVFFGRPSLGHAQRLPIFNF